MTQIVGDVHGLHHPLAKILHATEDEVICVGDVAVGFDGIGNRPFFRKNFRYLRGNHDKPDACRAHPQYLGDYGVYKGIFFLSGARSVDRHLRKEGRDWWQDEQLSIGDLMKAVDLYAETKPEVVISHEAPWFLHQELCDISCLRRPWQVEYGPPMEYPTPLAMDNMLKIHRPKLWIYGHWHLDWRKDVDGTRFICLDELSVLDLEKEMALLTDGTSPAVSA